MKKNWEAPKIKELKIEESQGGAFPGHTESSWVNTPGGSSTYGTSTSIPSPPTSSFS